MINKNNTRNMQLPKKERDALIRKIRRASGVAGYAIDAKMSDEQIILASNHLEALRLVKKANDYNRFCQREKTRAANDKLKALLKFEESEILKAGNWLLEAFNLKGESRKSTLIQKDLVEKSVYNQAVNELRDAIDDISNSSDAELEKSQYAIDSLESRIDVLQGHLVKIRDYINSNESPHKWQDIAARFDIDEEAL